MSDRFSVKASVCFGFFSMWFALFVAIVCFLMLLIELFFWPTPAHAGDTIVLGSQTVRCVGRPVHREYLGGITPGMAIKGALFIDPAVIRQEKPVVQKFIFYHECGHTYVGTNEYKADCWSAKKGAAEGWLQQKDLADICLSFAGPETDTHPSGARRCANVHQCFFKGLKNAASKPISNSNQ